MSEAKVASDRRTGGCVGLALGLLGTSYYVPVYLGISADPKAT
jgi:hypothetical protein